ncbi:hypothetical protein ACQQ2N_03055 [Dokdonella sp. MW10]|uniref:hypothetical protein n=1 Tax=Dokdonella sp. MW10 TaxID=2992926 RepID=UPI003F7F903E
MTTSSPRERSAITLEDLEAFFGCEGRLSDDDVPWPYQLVTFHRMESDWSVVASIDPVAPDISLRIVVAGRLVYELQAEQVFSLEVHANPQHRSLAIRFSDLNVIHVRLDPEPAVFHAKEAY